MLLLAAGVSYGRENTADWWVKRFPARYHVVRALTLTNPHDVNVTSAQYFIGIPIPTTDEYHDISNLRFSAGTLQTVPETGQKYLSIEAGSPPKKITIEFDITTYQILVDFDKLHPLAPYDRASKTYVSNTGESDLIEPQNPEIVNLAGAAARGSQDDLDYVMRAYDQEQRTLKWKDTGDYTNITATFQNGGGDCGGLSRVLISLLRNHGIPARYIAGGFLDSNGAWKDHVWVEFYLQNKGWIPADAAFFITGGRFVGADDGMRIFFNRGTDFTIATPWERLRLSWLQTYAFSYRLSAGTGEAPRYELKTIVTTISPSQEAETYNSPDFANTIFSKVIAEINGKRTARNLSPLVISNQLNGAAKTALSAGAPDKQIAASGYPLAYFYWWTWQFSFPGLHPEREVLSNLDEKLYLSANVSEIGFAWRYNSDHVHQAYVLFASRR